MFMFAVHVVLVGQNVMTVDNPWDAHMDFTSSGLPLSSTLLSAFSTWAHETQDPPGYNFDNAHLFTYLDFSGTTIGLAYIAAMCGSFSSGIDMTNLGSATASVVAHELC